MDTWKVYCYTGQNNKKYIGITKKTLIERSGTNGEHYNPNYHFGKAIRKYGFEYFTVEILEDNLSFEEANEKEKYYIDLYNTYEEGYNETRGGDGHQKIDWHKIKQLWDEGKLVGEITKNMQCSSQSVADALTTYGVDSKERVSKSAGQYHIKAVYQFDKQDNLIATYDSIADAERVTTINHSNIVACIKGRRKTAGGYIWRSSLETIIVDENKNKCKIVYQYSLDKQLITSYNSAEEAAKEMKCDKETIRRACRNKRVSQGYLWSYDSILDV